MKHYLYEASISLSGFSFAIIGLIGVRLFAPYLGSSVYVWTSYGSILLLALASGYLLGLWIAEGGARRDLLSFFLFLNGLLTFLIVLLAKSVLGFFSQTPFPLGVQTLGASLFLFLPGVLLWGIIVSYASQLKAKEVTSSGLSQKYLQPVFIFGLAIGLFFTNFFLVAWLSSVSILSFLAVIIIIFSIVCFHEKKLSKRSLTLGLILILSLVGQSSTGKAEAQPIRIFESQHGQVVVQPVSLGEIGSGYLLKKNGDILGVVAQESNDLISPHTRYYRLAKHFNPEIRSALMIGSGGYVYPRDFLASFPEAHLDVLEPDRAITEAAREYLNLKSNQRLSIYEVDGRIFLNQSQARYDVIFGDLYRLPSSLPYELTTKEAVAEAHRLLSPNGVFILNLRGSLAGDQSRFLASEYQTLRTVFPQVYVFPVTDKTAVELVQPIVLVAMKSRLPPALDTEDAELTHYLPNLWVGIIDQGAAVLTDDFAPVEYLMDISLENSL